MKTILKAVLLSVLVLLWTVPLVYAEGTFDILRRDPTIRGSALGEFPIAIAYDDLGASMINPAGLGLLEGRQVLMALNDHPLDLQGGVIAYGQPFLGGFASVGIQYFSYGDFTRYSTVESLGEDQFTASDIIAVGSYGLMVHPKLSLGISGKVLSSKIDDLSSHAVAADFGLLFQTGFSGVDIALTAQNIGVQTDPYDNVYESIPTIFRFGVSNQLDHLPLKLTGTVHYESSYDPYATGSGEFTVSPLLKLRAGYSTRAADYLVQGSEDGGAGLSAGLGLFWKQSEFGYAFQSQGGLGTVHKMGLSQQF